MTNVVIFPNELQDKSKCVLHLSDEETLIERISRVIQRQYIPPSTKLVPSDQVFIAELHMEKEPIRVFISFQF